MMDGRRGAMKGGRGVMEGWRGGRKVGEGEGRWERGMEGR